MASTPRTPATRPDPRPGALERCVGDPEAFARDRWGAAPLHRSGDDDFADVFSLADVDTILTSATRRPEIRLVRDGARVDPGRYCTRLRLGGREVDDVVDPAKVTDLVAAGATLVLQSLHRTWPPVGRFTAELEREVSHPVQANAYLTPPGASGLAPHADEHDVVVLQLHGSKRWQVEGRGELTLVPGDTLYVPAGTTHAAGTGETSSLHLTVGLLRVTYRSVLARVLRGAGGILDEPLPLGYAAAGLDPELRGGIEQLLAEVAKHLEAADPEEIAAAERRRRRPRSRHVGHLSSVVRLGDLDQDAVLRLRDGAPPRIETAIDDRDGRLRLDLGDRTLRLPVSTEPALRCILDRGSVAVGDLPGLDASSRSVLARRLVVEGMVVLDPPPA